MYWKSHKTTYVEKVDIQFGMGGLIRVKNIWIVLFYERFQNAAKKKHWTNIVNINTTDKMKNANINRKDQIDYIFLMYNQRQQLFDSLWGIN